MKPSLFRPIPPRSCVVTGIPPRYCMCRRTLSRCESDCSQEFVENAPCKTQCSSKHMVKLGEILVEKLNMIVMEKIPVKCQKWKFQRIITYDELLDRSTGKISYLVGIQVEPKATFRGELSNSTSEEKFSVIRIPERTSLYGKTADCLKDTELKEFCHCLK